MRSSIHLCAYCNPPSPWFEWCVQWDEIDHTAGETPPELFEKSCGLFYILFELTNERMKEIRPTPNITAQWNGYLSKGEKWELHDLSSFNTLVGGLARIWGLFLPLSKLIWCSSKLTGKQLAKLEGPTQYNQVEIHTSSEMLGAAI